MRVMHSFTIFLNVLNNIHVFLLPKICLFVSLFFEIGKTKQVLMELEGLDSFLLVNES